MSNLFSKLLALLKSRRGARYKFYPVGFHGDKHLGELVFHCLSLTDQFVETGCNVGSTFRYVLQHHPALAAYSCEPDITAFHLASSRIAKFKNARLFNQVSQQMLRDLICAGPDVTDKDTVFWLDAHGYGHAWPLKEELALITQHFKMAYVFIDDFRVPGREIFQWGEYDGHICSLKHVSEAIHPDLNLTVYLPAYVQRTSRHHPLVGWALLDFGHSRSFALPHNLVDKIERLRLSRSRECRDDREVYLGD